MLIVPPLSLRSRSEGSTTARGGGEECKRDIEWCVVNSEISSGTGARSSGACYNDSRRRLSA